VAVQSYTTPRLYTERERDLLISIANQAATAIENARLFEQAQARAEEMAILNEMGRELSSLREVDAVFESAHRHSSRLIDTTNFYIALYDAESDEVSFPYYAEGEQIRRAGRRRAGTGMTEYVIRTREPLLIKEDISAWLAERGIEQIGRSSESWLGAPMLAGGQVTGVVAVQSYTTPWLYDEHDRDLLSAITNQVAIAIESARLFQQAQSSAERERLVRTITDKVRRGVDTEAVMRVTLEELSRMLRASKSVVRLGTQEQLLSNWEASMHEVEG